MHKGFWYINEKLSDYGFRSILLTNGTLITKDTAKRLKVNEAQVSLDGMRGSHDALRGKGTFDLALDGIRHISDAGIAVSVATTLNALNAPELAELGCLIGSLGVTEWNVDMPSVAGRLAENRELLLPPAEAANYMSLGFGGSHHGGAEGYACGSHLCAVGARGQVGKCGFYLDNPAGRLPEGLRDCWDRLAPLELSKLSCDCEHISTCKGGCRFRAASYTGEFGPDPVRCHNLGVGRPELEGGDMHDHKENS
jgi:radical SAM protein with 4Fe4S-binding SPASM domain